MHPLTSSERQNFDFEAELAKIQPQLRYFALSLTGSVDDAEEVIQETNTIALEKSHQFEPGTNLRAWLFKIASFQSRSFHRKRSRRRGYEIVDDGLLDSIAEESEGFCEENFEKERSALLLCLEKLRPAHQELIASRYIHERRIADLAIELETKANALAQKLFRIRNRLAACIQDKLEKT